MNALAIRRVWLVWRSDIAAAVALVLFMIAGFWAAGPVALLLKAVME